MRGVRELLCVRAPHPCGNPPRPHPRCRSLSPRAAATPRCHPRCCHCLPPRQSSTTTAPRPPAAPPWAAAAARQALRRTRQSRQLAAARQEGPVARHPASALRPKLQRHRGEKRSSRVGVGVRAAQRPHLRAFCELDACAPRPADWLQAQPCLRTHGRQPDCHNAAFGGVTARAAVPRGNAARCGRLGACGAHPAPATWRRAAARSVTPSASRWPACVTTACRLKPPRKGAACVHNARRVGNR